MARLAHPLAQPVKDEELRRPLSVVDEIGWLGGDVRNWRVLCLAAGGGRHSALYAAPEAWSPWLIECGDVGIGPSGRPQHQFTVRLFKRAWIHYPCCRMESLTWSIIQ